MKDFSGEESAVKVHVWDLHPSTYLHYDEEIRSRVHDPPFDRFGVIWRTIRKKHFYVRIRKGSQERRPEPCNGRPLSIRYFDVLARTLKMSRAELETHVDYVKSGQPGNAAILALRFPLGPTLSHVFLAGLWQGTGGVCTRWKEQTFRFAMIPEIVSIVCAPKFVAAIGESPQVRSKSAMVNRLAGERWQRKSLDVQYCRTTLSIMQKFLQVNPETQKRGVRRGRAGRFIAFREMSIRIPDWIQSNPRFMHAYLEGYLNGGKIQLSILHSTKRVVANIHFAVRFSGVSARDTWRFARAVSAFLSKHGAVGGLRELPRWKNHRLTHLEYSVTTPEGCRRLIEGFQVKRWKLLLMLRVKVDRDPRMLKLMQQSDIRMVVIAALLKYEGPKSNEELNRRLSIRPTTCAAAVERLLSKGMIVQDGDVYRFDPSEFLKGLAASYRRRIDENETQLRVLESSLPTASNGRPVRRGNLMRPLLVRASRLKIELGKVTQ